jgi:serine/threonine protein kinase
MSEVFQARYHGSEGFSRPVAFKRMSAELSQDREWSRAFLDEAKLTARFTHPNLLPTLDAGLDEGRYFLVSEWIEGCTARALLREHGHLSPANAVAITLPLLRALHPAHEM